MHLYLIRHTQPDPSTCENPPLSAEGVHQAQQLGRFFRQLQLPFETLEVVSGPFARAFQTAQILCDSLGCTHPPAVHALVSDEGQGDKGYLESPIDTLRALVCDETRTDLLVVGSYPRLRLLFDWLLGSTANDFPLAHGAVACIRCPRMLRPGRASLRWLLTADDLLPVKTSINAHPKKEDSNWT